MRHETACCVCERRTRVGQTTLASLLSEQLYLPHVASDLVHGGVEYAYPGHDRKETIEMCLCHCYFL